MNIAITGSSGNIGGMVARQLSTRDLPQLLGRAPRRFAEVVKNIYTA